MLVKFTSPLGTFTIESKERLLAVTESLPPAPSEPLAGDPPELRTNTESPKTLTLASARTGLLPPIKLA